MTVLHIAHVHTAAFSGVCIVVPQHILSQQRYEQIGYVNTCNLKADGVNNQFDFTKDFKVGSLPAPFNTPDLVVFHGIYYSEYLNIYKELIKNKIPYVIVAHGGLTKASQNIKKFKKTVANILFFKRFISKSSGIQFLSEMEKERSLFSEKGFVGPNGFFMPTVQKKSFNPDGCVFSFIGRFDIYIKGLDLLIEAILKIKEYLLKEKAVFLLYGPDRFGSTEKLKALIEEKRLDGLVKICAPVLGAEKEKALLNSDVFVQTSRTEGLPTSILEAMSYGLPCLVTYETNLGAAISENDCGWAARCDSDMIADKIKTAIEERSTWRNKGLNAIKYIDETFRWDIVGKNNLELYSKITDGELIL